MKNTEHDPLSPLDQAVADRLVELKSTPIETADLQLRISNQLWDKTSQAPASSSKWQISTWLKPLSAIAAVLAIGITLVIFSLTSATPAIAAPVELSKLHHELVTGHLFTTTVKSIADANQLIAKQRSDAPMLPHNQRIKVQSCCLTRVQGVLVASALIKVQNQLVSLIVAHGKDFALPSDHRIIKQGRPLVTHQTNGINMVMTNRDDQWLCVMGDVPMKVLIDIACEVVF